MFQGQHFDGPEYEPDKDRARLGTQLERIFALMSDERWRTLAQIEAATGASTASCSAQLRHLRKQRFGSHTVERRARGDRSNGLFEYRVVVLKQGQTRSLF